LHTGPQVVGGRKGGLITAARHDPKVYTRSARRAFLERFEREVDPDETLPVAEHQRRALAAKKAYFTDLALRSARARRGSKRRRVAEKGGQE
jgi:hypothetical protein